MAARQEQKKNNDNRELGEVRLYSVPVRTEKVSQVWKIKLSALRPVVVVVVATNIIAILLSQAISWLNIAKWKFSQFTSPTKQIIRWKTFPQRASQ
jgi:hypothetical protein